jgi:RNA polymerase sigma factor (TIGR02999 family)
MSSAAEITDTFNRWRNGEAGALDALVPMLYDDMREMAAYYLRQERVGHTLQPTALAHEVFLRLIQQRDVTWQNRAHFMGLVAQIMRRVLADHARRHGAQKRGGGLVRVGLEDQEIASQGQVGADELDTALENLAKLEGRQAKVVELRFYGGLSIEETAEVLGTSPATVKRDWAIARAWLHRELGGAQA